MSFIRQSIQGGWNSRWTFIVATTGATVGLGNLWKFSYMAGENGGGAFVIAYLLCVLLVGLPVMIAEVVIGSRGRANPVSTTQDLSREAGANSAWQLIGWLGCLSGFLILSYYSVIAGWGFAYVGKMLGGEFQAGSTALAGENFNVFLSDPVAMMKWQGAYLTLLVLIAAFGVSRGLAWASRLIVPRLLISLVLLAIYSMRVGDVDAALAFMLTFDADSFTLQSLLDAMGHAFFTLSIGVGALMAFGAYVPDRRSIIGMLSMVALLDTVVALLAGMVIFPLVFSLNIEPSMGPGLMFVALPHAFGNMQYGGYFGALFFIMVSLTAVSSGVALLEPATAWLVERFSWRRPLAVLFLGLLLWLLGLVTVFSFNAWAAVKLFGMNPFTLLDFVSANILLPVGGVLIAVFVAWRMRRETVRDELYVENEPLFVLWRWVLRYIAGPAVLVIFASLLYQRLLA
jgi:NSS family neurotransmitter:Na+ symporter